MGSSTGEPWSINNSGGNVTVNRASVKRLVARRPIRSPVSRLIEMCLIGLHSTVRFRDLSWCLVATLARMQRCGDQPGNAGLPYAVNHCGQQTVGQYIDYRSHHRRSHKAVSKFSMFILIYHRLYNADLCTSLGGAIEQPNTYYPGSPARFLRALDHLRGILKWTQPRFTTLVPQVLKRRELGLFWCPYPDCTGSLRQMPCFQRALPNT